MASQSHELGTPSCDSIERRLPRSWMLGRLMVKDLVKDLSILALQTVPSSSQGGECPFAHSVVPRVRCRCCVDRSQDVHWGHPAKRMAEAQPRNM